MRKKWKMRAALGIIAAATAMPVTGSDMTPSIDSQTVMFYYKNIEAAADFYGTSLGLPVSLDSEWVKIFQVSETSSVGVVTEGEGAYHKAQTSNAVMLSIVTGEVDAWYDQLKADENIIFIKDIYNSDSVPIRAFLVEDPGGYTVEFYQWLSNERETP